MKPYRTILSDKIFHYLLKEVYKSLHYDILTKNEESQANQRGIKIEPGQQIPTYRDSYKVRANGDVFRVHLDDGGPINENQSKQGKWRCDCEFE
jgi:hypothetical protein